MADVELNAYVLNTVDDIKRALMLEVENQTLSDDDFRNYLNDAYDEMLEDIGRSMEIENFRAYESEDVIMPDSGEGIFTTYFNIQEIVEIKVNDTAITTDDYELISRNDRVSIDSITSGDEVEISYIPKNYKILEKAICLVNILTRLNPFTNDTVNPSYAKWIKKRDDAARGIKSKIGTALYSG